MRQMLARSGPEDIFLRSGNPRVVTSGRQQRSPPAIDGRRGESKYFATREPKQKAPRGAPTCQAGWAIGLSVTHIQAIRPWFNITATQALVPPARQVDQRGSRTMDRMKQQAHRPAPQELDRTRRGRCAAPGGGGAARCRRRLATSLRVTVTCTRLGRR
jgi:hypothetical protein